MRKALRVLSLFLFSSILLGQTQAEVVPHVGHVRTEPTAALFFQITPSGKAPGSAIALSEPRIELKLGDRVRLTDSGDPGFPKFHSTWECPDRRPPTPSGCGGSTPPPQPTNGDYTIGYVIAQFSVGHGTPYTKTLTQTDLPWIFVAPSDGTLTLISQTDFPPPADCSRVQEVDAQPPRQDALTRCVTRRAPLTSPEVDPCR